MRTGIAGLLGGLVALGAIVGCTTAADRSASASDPLIATNTNAIDCMLDAPDVEIVGSTPGSLTVRGCAGNSGAPSGVSLQWMTYDDYLANGWSSNNATYCSATYNRTSAPYSLGPNQCIAIQIDGSSF